MNFRYIETDAVVAYKVSGEPERYDLSSVPDFVNQALRSKSSFFERLFKDGFPCKVLRPGHGWQKGRFKIFVEFHPDESVNLDE